MTAVFVPVAFITGPAGIFYRQFSLTMAIAIVLSGIVALTLTPLCAPRFCARHDAPPGAPRSPLLRLVQSPLLSESKGRYAGLLRRTAARRLVTLVLLAAFVVGTGLVSRSRFRRASSPSEDQGMFYASVTTPPGATLERTKEVVDAIQTAGQDIDGVESIATLAGTNVLSDGTGATYGTCLVNLKPWDERRAVGRTPSSTRCARGCST